MEKIIKPRIRLENETEKEYKDYLRSFYFNQNKPNPETRYDYAKENGLEDNANTIDGRYGYYVRYLKKYYDNYYKALEQQVNLTFNMNKVYTSNTDKEEIVEIKEAKPSLVAKAKNKFAEKKNNLKNNLKEKNNIIKEKFQNTKTAIKEGKEAKKEKRKERKNKIEEIKETKKQEIKDLKNKIKEVKETKKQQLKELKQKPVSFISNIKNKINEKKKERKAKRKNKKPNIKLINKLCKIASIASIVAGVTMAVLTTIYLSGVLAFGLVVVSATAIGIGTDGLIRLIKEENNKKEKRIQKSSKNNESQKDYEFVLEEPKEEKCELRVIEQPVNCTVKKPEDSELDFDYMFIDQDKDLDIEEEPEDYKFNLEEPKDYEFNLESEDYKFNLEEPKDYEFNLEEPKDYEFNLEPEDYEFNLEEGNMNNNKKISVLRKIINEYKSVKQDLIEAVEEIKREDEFILDEEAKQDIIQNNREYIKNK